MKTLMIFTLLMLAMLQPVPAFAQRILALSPHACEMLYAIGAGSQIVGAVSYCDYPDAAEKLPRIGSYERINVEAALRLQPDVAVVINRNVKGVEMLERMGVRIVVSNPEGFAGMFADILQLGELTNHSPDAEVLVAALRQRLGRVRNMKRSDAAVFYEVWPDPLLTAGGPSFISDLIHEAGGKNIFAEVDVETPRVNVEAVVRAKPEVIIVPLEKRDLHERQAFWEAWLGKGNVRFAAIDPDLLHRPGPRLLDGLELLQQALSQGAVR